MPAKDAEEVVHAWGTTAPGQKVLAVSEAKAAALKANETRQAV